MDRIFSGFGYDIVNNRSFPVDVEKYDLALDKE